MKDMKAIDWFYLSIVMVLMGAVSFEAFMPDPTPLYQYDIIAVPDTELPETLTLLGEQGWTIMNARRAVNQNNDALYELIIQRPDGEKRLSRAN